MKSPAKRRTTLDPVAASRWKSYACFAREGPTSETTGNFFRDTHGSFSGTIM